MGSSVKVANYHPPKLNHFVPNMQFSADVGLDRPVRMDLGAPVATAAAGILSAQSIASAGTATTFATTYTSAKMSNFGRNVTIVLSGAGTPTVTIRGRDYLSQPMTEVLTGAGAATVAGKKAFKVIESITWTAVAATTMNVGWADVLGLPYKTNVLVAQLENDASAAAGTFVRGSDLAQSGTSDDPRGTYDPASACDGTKTFVVHGICDTVALQGKAHYYA